MKIRKRILGAMGVAGVVLLALVMPASAAGIADTKHNLSSGAAGTQIHQTNTAEICVFCHTPHGSDTAIEAPLWNRGINTGVYEVYASPSFDAGTNNAAPPPDGVSLACLSCHDGTIAFDALRNLPGSGGYNPSAPSAGYTFQNTGGGNVMPNDGRITNLGFPLSGGNPDLRNDHPVSMIYANALSPSSTSGTNDHATGFKDPPSGISATGDSYFVNGVKIVKGKVQCTSCHDPHRSNTPTFLRVDNGNQNSQVCLTCHNKDG